MMFCTKEFWIPFGIMLASGVFLFFAGGFEWGTSNCGNLFVGTLIIALIMGYFFQSRSEKLKKEVPQKPGQQQGR